MPGRLQAVQPGLQPGAQGCRAEQVPAVAQGLCAGAGTLPPARLSTQLPGELPRALRGDVWGEGAPRHGSRAGQGRAGQGPSAATAAAWGRGITATLHPRVFPRALCKRRDKAGIFLFFFLGKGKEL